MKKIESNWIEKSARRGITISVGALAVLGTAMLVPTTIGGGGESYR